MDYLVKKHLIKHTKNGTVSFVWLICDIFQTTFLIHTYHSRFIPEAVAEASQIFRRGTHVLPKLFSYE
jgi:hypothetical protein